MTSNDSIEISAATIDQAINQALAQLGAAQDDVTIEVLSTPRAGVLGLGARQARVRVTRRAPEIASSGVTSPPPAPPLVRQQPQAAPPPAKQPESGAKAIHREAAAESLSTPAEGMAAENESEDFGEDISAPSREAAAPRASAETAALVEEATSLLARILDLMGEKAESESVGGYTAENLELNIKGDGSGLLIGRHGQTLDAL